MNPQLLSMLCGTSPNPRIPLRKLPRPNLPLALTSNLLIARGALIRSKCPVNSGVPRTAK